MTAGVLLRTFILFARLDANDRGAADAGGSDSPFWKRATCSGVFIGSTAWGAPMAAAAVVIISDPVV